MSFRTRLPRNSPKAETRCLETRSPRFTGRGDIARRTRRGTEDTEVGKGIQIFKSQDVLPREPTHLPPLDLRVLRAMSSAYERPPDSKGNFAPEPALTPARQDEALPWVFTSKVLD